MRGKSVSRSAGFTLIELLVVMAIIATLLSIAVPRYFKSVDRSKEAVLKQDLGIFREAIDKYYSDKGVYPNAIEDLVENRYLRSIPADPLTDSASTWIAISPPDTAKGTVYDIRSGATGNSSDGTPYNTW